jgi:transposase-like protein
MVKLENIPKILSFPTDDAVLKSVYLALREATKNGQCQSKIGD